MQEQQFRQVRFVEECECQSTKNEIGNGASIVHEKISRATFKVGTRYQTDFVADYKARPTMADYFMDNVGDHVPQHPDHR